MNLLRHSNENYRKCGEITTALKVGKKVYALNCWFCSKAFIELFAFTMHIGEDHQEELFGCLDDVSCEELTVIDRNENILTEFKVENIAEEIKFVEITEDGEETVLSFQDPLEDTTICKIFKETPSVSDVKEDDETMVLEENEENYYNCDDKYTNKKNDADFELDSTKTEIDSEGDNEQDYLDEDNETKELTSAIIAGFKKHQILWDSSKPMKKTRKQRIEAHKIIATSITKQMGMHFKWKAIRDRIKNLRSKFRSELQKQKQAESRGKIYTPIWYYNKLSFLKESLKDTLENKTFKIPVTKLSNPTDAQKLELIEIYKCKIKKNEETISSKLPNLTDAQNLELIEIYKSFTSLWDVQHMEFHFRNKREISINEMIQKIKTKMNLDLTHNEVEKIIQNIRDNCIQEKYRKLECERSNKIFTPLCKFYEQISFLENNVRPFKCDFCGETFIACIKYKQHRSTHDGLKPFICQICNRGYKSAWTYTLHVRRHTSDYPFECKECKKTYAEAGDLKKHMRYHSTEKPYFCEICGKSFLTCSQFDIHLRHHQKRPGHSCTICPKAFYRKGLLNEHMNAHFNIRDKVCNVCGKSFTASKYLQQHQQIHAEKKKHVCKICGKDYAQYTSLNIHMKSHGTTVSGN